MHIRLDMRALCIFAHPDDESFIVGGTACRAAARGDSVALVTATRGGAGKVGEPALTTREALPVVRERELRAACAILGIGDLTLFDYPDRELAAAPIEEIRERLVTVVRRVRPHVVITFDPNGSNLHPDHIAISRFAVDALTAAADPRWLPDVGAPYATPRLLWTPPTTPWRSTGVRARPKDTPGSDVVVDVREWADRKADALRAHRTQHLQIDRLFFGPDGARVLGIEIFRQAWGPALPERPIANVFAGLDG
jgi:LmbE family N-acetylglucosaminyl deacetylase